MSRDDFPPEEFAERRRRLFQAMEEIGLDWFLIFHPTSIHWLTGAEAKSYQAFQCLVADARGGRLTMFTREAERNESADEALVDDLHSWGAAGAADPVDSFLGLADRLGMREAQNIGMEVPAYYLHPHHYLRLLRSFAAGPREHPNLVHDLRFVKSPREIAYLREAARIADVSIGVVARSLAVGRSELDIAAELYHSILSSGGDVPAVPPNIVSGPRAAHSHGGPSARRLAPGDFGNAEYCVPYKRHTVSIGRQFAIGEPTARMRELTAVVREATDACIAAIGDGVPASAPHAAALKVIEAAGLAPYRVHTTGYAVASAFPPATGEPLHLAANSGYTLRSGMMLSICPNVFIQEERLGARIVDNVLVTDTGAEILSTFPRDLIVVE
jgi:Xaa-Pro dipeptidase